MSLPLKIMRKDFSSSWPSHSGSSHASIDSDISDALLRYIQASAKAVGEGLIRLIVPRYSLPGQQTFVPSSVISGFTFHHLQTLTFSFCISPRSELRLHSPASFLLLNPSVPLLLDGIYCRSFLYSGFCLICSNNSLHCMPD